MWSNSRTSKILLALIFICIGVMQYTIFPLFLPLFLVMGGTLIADIFIPQRKWWTCLREILYYGAVVVAVVIFVVRLLQ